MKNILTATPRWIFKLAHNRLLSTPIDRHRRPKGHLLKRITLLAGITVATITNANALDIVKNGEPKAEIIVAKNALPQVQLAARELRDHVKEMSGAELPIVNAPTDKNKKPIYVGVSEFTKKLGLTTDGLEPEGFKIVATDDYLALFGKDARFPRYPRGYENNKKDHDRLLKEWQEFCGEKWNFPFQQIYDPRNYNAEFGFSLFDPSGTLSAVYDFLERQGVRWYMPDEELGTVIPEKKDIVIETMDVSDAPAFEERFLRFGWGKDTPIFLWFKRLKLGVAEMLWIMHGTSEVTCFTHDEHPEYLAQIGGMVQKHRGKRKNTGLPRLAPPLRDAMAAYIDKFFERYPEMRVASAGPHDAFTSIDDRDAAAGWLREDRGYAGRLSDYVWTFINDVAKIVEKKYPDRTVMGLAYSFYRIPPTDIEKLNDNVGVCYCQHRGDAITNEKWEETQAERNAWLEKLTSDDFYVWEYFLWTRKNDSQLIGFPIFFPTIMARDMRALNGKCKGEYVEGYAHNGNWGLWHPTYYLQAKLYWEPDLDVNAFLDDYCECFYGPAKDEMREFLDLAEKIWMRDEPRTITRTGGFLKKEDVNRFFAILAKAKAKAGDTIYGKRIDLVAKQCEPMRDIFKKLEATKRLGPDFLAPRITDAPKIDGDLSDPCWTTKDGTFRDPKYLARNLKTEKVVEPATTVMLRWAEDNSGLYVAVSCAEPEMDKLNPQAKENDSFSVFDNDVVEIFLETPERSAFRAAINVNDVIYDACTDVNVEPGGTKWNSEWTFATKREKDCWNVELFISRKSLDDASIPANDDPWGINVCRTRYVTGQPENSAISPTHGKFFTIPRFGSVIVK